MNTPIADFVKKYQKKATIRLHMPGHKGKTLSGPEKSDITEIKGADVLYSCDGIIKESQENAANLFNTQKTLYSTEGSSLAIRAMLFMVCLRAQSLNKKPLIFAARNAHNTFVTAAGILNIDVKWLYGDKKSYMSCNISPEMLEESLCGTKEKPIAVYLTSPDYLGNLADIKGISAVCEKYGCLLLVDNAHGAYLRFLDENIHPINQGAHICCDSAHKTLRVLTGGAYLHIAKTAPEFFAENAEKAMATFASTSPSYLILQSLDFENRYLEERYAKDLKILVERIDALKKNLQNAGFSIIGQEKTKLTLSAKKYGYKGFEMAEILQKNNIFCEFCDEDFLCLMFSTANTKKDIKKTQKVLLKIEKKQEIRGEAPSVVSPTKQISIKKAIKMPMETILVNDAKGRIAADNFFGCPPAIKIICAGEKINQNVQNVLNYYNIEKINVLKETLKGE